MRATLWERWGPLTGILSVACSFVGTMTVLNQPEDGKSDATIVAYFARHSHRVTSQIGFLVFLAGVLLLFGFLVSLRGRLLAADAGRAASVAFGAGLATLPLLAGSMVLADATGFAAGDASSFRVDPNTYRLLGTASYLAWMAAVAVAALVVWAVSAAALRTAVLPRWFGWLGILVGASMLLGMLFLPFFTWWIWLVLASVLLVRRPARAPAPLAHALG